MSRFLIQIACLIAILFPCFSGGQLKAVQETDGAKVTQEIDFGVCKHDFGPVPVASKQQHTFSFLNTLDSELQLLYVRQSCGCVGAKILTPEVPPGSEGHLRVDYDTWRHDSSNSATITLGYRVETEQQNREVQFQIQGVIRRDVVVSPVQVSFGTVSKGHKVSTRVKVKYAGDPDWRIVRVESSNPNLVVEVSEDKRDSKTGRIEYGLKVGLAEHQTPGAFSEIITLVTSDRENQNVRVAVDGLVTDIIETSSVDLGTVKQYSKIKKQVAINGRLEFAITGASTGNSRLRFQIPSEKKRLHFVEYELDTTKVGDVSTVVKLFTDLPSLPEISIPFRVTIVPGSLPVQK